MLESTYFIETTCYFVSISQGQAGLRCKRCSPWLWRQLAAYIKGVHLPLLSGWAVNHGGLSQA